MQMGRTGRKNAQDRYGSPGSRGARDGGQSDRRTSPAVLAAGSDSALASMAGPRLLGGLLVAAALARLFWRCWRDLVADAIAASEGIEDCDPPADREAPQLAAGRGKETPHTDKHPPSGGREGVTMRSEIAHADPTVVHEPVRALKRRRPNHSPKLPTAAQVMFRHPAVVDAHTSLFSAWGLLRGDHHQHLVVIDDDVRPIGILDERDIALEWPPNPLGAHHLPVHQLIRFRPGPRVHDSDDLAEVARTMLEHRTDAVAVVDDDGRLLGLITVCQYLEFIAAWSMKNGLLRDESEPTPALAR